MFFSQFINERKKITTTETKNKQLVCCGFAKRYKRTDTNSHAMQSDDGRYSDVSSRNTKTMDKKR